MAITLRLKDKIKKILPRSMALSIGIFLFAAIIINTIPAGVLASSLKQSAEDEGLKRAKELTESNDFIALDGERIILTTESALIIYDSEGKLEGRYLLTEDVRKGLLGEDLAKSNFEDGGLDTTALHCANGKLAYVYRRDENAAGVLSTMQISLFAVTLIVGIAILLVINLEACRTKKRVDALIEGVSSRKHNGPIKLQGEDELSQLAEELNKLSRQIMEAEQLRRNFVSDASHELRTPLSAIQLLLDSIIQTENIDVETTKEFMTDMSDQIDRLTRIAERLLILTNLEGAKELVLEKVDMKKVAEKVIATLEPTAREEEVALKCSFAEDVVFMGTSDGTYQIIFNLVENAIKYNRPGGKVRVYIFKSDGMCNLIVDDDGIGIPEEAYGLIFERFYRVDKARSRDKGGSGLGLAIVAKTVGSYNGEIKVEPSVDGGVRFTVTFPEEVAK